MLCFLCGKKIGFVRRMIDQQYCSSNHRKEAKLASAQAFREEDDLEHWSVARIKDKKKGAVRPQPTAGYLDEEIEQLVTPRDIEALSDLASRVRARAKQLGSSPPAR